MSIELPVTTRYRRAMTEKLLKETLNLNSHTHTVHKFTDYPYLYGQSLKHGEIFDLLTWRFLLLLVYIRSSPYDDISMWGTSDNIQSIISTLISDKNYVLGKLYVIKELFQASE